MTGDLTTKHGGQSFPAFVGKVKSSFYYESQYLRACSDWVAIYSKHKNNSWIGMEVGVRFFLATIQALSINPSFGCFNPIFDTITVIKS